MELTRLTKRNHYEEITELIKQQIIEGKLKVGDKLPSTKEMSERFGVGRSTTREALSALKAMGLIEIRQGGGCRVIASAPAEIELPELQSMRMNRELLLEFMEARQTFEVSNASMAAVKRNDEDLRLLGQLMEEMEAGIGDDLEGERTDLQFHMMIAKATHNSVMIRIFESVISQFEVSIGEIRRVQLYANRSVAKRLYEEHSAIYEAIREGNANRAANRMKRHLQNVESVLLKYI